MRWGNGKMQGFVTQCWNGEKEGANYSYCGCTSTDLIMTFLMMMTNASMLLFDPKPAVPCDVPIVHDLVPLYLKLSFGIVALSLGLSLNTLKLVRVDMWRMLHSPRAVE